MSLPTPILQYNLSDATVKGLLPSGYTPLAYLESTGTLWINTGWHTNTYPLKLETEVVWTNFSGEKDFFGNFGSDVSSSSNCFVCGVYSNKTYQWGGSTFFSDADVLLNKKLHLVFTYESNSRTMVIDGVSKSMSATHTFLSHTSPIGVFSGAGNRNYCGASVKMYYARIWSGNTLGVDLRPARRDSDGALGMYDLVSKTFKTNSGTGTFIAGPELAIGKGGGTSLPEEYLLVEYLLSDGNQFINTGLVVTSSNGKSYDFEAQVVPLKFTNYQVVAGVNTNTLFAWSTGGVACIGNAYSSSVFFTLNKMAKITGKFASTALTYYVDGVSTGLSREINTETNIYLFGIGISGYNMVGLLLYAKFGSDRFFIPCYRKSDMKPGMYDTVNGVFYTNAGSGEFILGPTVTNVYTWEPNAGSGTQQGLYTNVSGAYNSSKGWVGDFSTNASHFSATIPSIGNNFSISWWELSSSFNSGTMPWGIYPFNPLYSKCLNTGDGSSNPWYKPGTTTAIDSITDNVWHHFVVTGNGSANYLYVDGIKIGQSKTFKGLSGTTLVMNGWSISTDYCRNPKITNFRIFNTALTDAQVKELYGQ